MEGGGSVEAMSEEHVMAQASDILKPTLQDNDFLQSFVRIGLEDSANETKRASGASQQSGSKDGRDHHHQGATKIARSLSKGGTSSDFREAGSSGRRSRNEDSRGKRGTESTHRPPAKNSVEYELDVRKNAKGRRRQKNVTFRQEEVYTDKDRAAAVNMGSRDIIQSLKMKRRQDRNRELQIPDEAEPGAMLALGAREMRTGDVGIAIKCINKALELSPNDKNALIARSKCYLLLGEPQKALQDAEAALNEKIKDPNNARAMYYKAEALYHLGDFELSLVYYYRGMRIRPEFDQFRLGVQKAKEAIMNILGNNCMSIPMEMPQQKPELSKEPPTHINESEDTQPSYSKQLMENNNNDNNNNGSDKKKKKVVTKPEDLAEKRRNSVPAKRKGNAPNLLGQLNVDKKYLQDLLKCPDIKAAHQASAQHIMSHAEEGIAFLENRQEFWRQQHSTHQPLSK